MEQDGEVLKKSLIQDENANNISENKSFFVDKSNFNDKNSFKSPTVPYILNGELYQILDRNGENVTVKCCSCPSGRFYRGSVRSTGNFHMHIKRRHPYLMGKLHDMKVHSLLERRDRLMKNRKAKLRRVFSKNKDEHEMHKLKIKRAFQRHQAEAKVNQEQDVIQEISTELINSQCIAKDSVMDYNCTNKLYIDANSATKNILGISTVNSCNNFNMQNMNTSSENMEKPLSQQSTPAVTPYPSTCDGSTFGEQSPLAFSGFKDESSDLQRPLDLSCSIRTSNSQSKPNASNDSGIGLAPIWTGTTVANTVSAAEIFTGQTNSRDSSISDSGDLIWWQQNINFMLRDIRSDIRARNRIEQNRLLLEIAKFKFLHPGFYFNYQG